MNKGSDPKDKTVTTFTVDTGSEMFSDTMPSITRLLLRKKTNLSNNLPKDSKTSKPSQTADNKPAASPSSLSPASHPAAPTALDPAAVQGSEQQEEITSSELPIIPNAGPLELKMAEGTNPTLISLSSISAHNVPPASPAAPVAPIAPAAASPVSSPVMRRTTRRTEAAPLAEWTVAMLQQGNDPLGKGILSLLRKGAQTAVYLNLQPPASGSNLPTFTTSAAINAGEKAALWRGLRWDPAVAPDIWNQLLRVGFAEYGPPGTTTNMKSARNIARAAFGISSNEWLLLIRIGPADQWRGLLAVVGPATLLAELPSTLSYLFAAIRKAA